MKKGFTLIELLAVIVILAIIALIATPIILGIIEDARIGSIEASANGYIDAVEYQIARDEIKGTETSSGVYDVTSLDVDIDGEKPISGTVTVQNGDILEATLIINDKKVYYDGTIAKIAYEDKLLNGADPVIKDELVPVTIANDGTVKKANIGKEWYNYTNKEWANAVILFEGNSYKAGEEIPKSNIKEYYVWIPRYAYKLWNVNSDNTEMSEKPIKIVFGSKAKTTGTNNGDMYLHPAFTNFNTQGIWVGKFEVSYNEETFTNKDTFLTTNPNTAIATDPSNIIIKQNVRSLTNKNVSEFHNLIFNSHTNLNSHVMTNIEWGAAAYLTYSIHGRCDKNTCTEVTINNINTGYYGDSKLYPVQWEYGTTITGCAADSISQTGMSNKDSCINEYNSEKGYLASITGNITGIYDMSGGNWEYVMGVLTDSKGKIFSGNNSIYNSGFKGIYGCPTCNNDTSGITENTDGIDMIDSKYYNGYKNNYELSDNIWYDYREGLLGDATKEFAINKTEAPNDFSGLWFGDHAIFVTPSGTWFNRGGNWHSESGAGILRFSRNLGSMGVHVSTRAVLAF